MHDQQPHILLADNEPHFIYLLQRYAARSGYQLVHTHTSSELVALGRQVTPTAIIIDLSLPELDVNHILCDLRSDAVTQHIPVVLCGSSEPLLRTWEAEVDGCWLKPLLYDDFENMLIAIGVPVLAAL